MAYIEIINEDTATGTVKDDYAYLYLSASARATCGFVPMRGQ